MKKEDEEKTAFITPWGVYCYTTMPFGLKNAGAMYQRMMQNCLKEQIGKNAQVYFDDIVVKSKKAETLIDDLKETFAALDVYKIKLNPKKCAFGVPQGELLGYLLSARDIKANEEGSANQHEGSAAASRTSRSTQQNHRQAGRESTSLLQNTEEVRNIQVDSGG